VPRVASETLLVQGLPLEGLSGSSLSVSKSGIGLGSVGGPTLLLSNSSLFSDDCQRR
jgi:hypothetical protein